MPRTKDEGFLESDQEIVIREVPEDETFHVGQCYDKIAVTTLECENCGSREFNVGQGSFFTVLRCPKCKWESCVHNG